MVLHKDNHISGLEIMHKETELLEKRVNETCDHVAAKVYGTSTPNVAVYLYGSPGRREMIGGDGDADIFVLEECRTNKSKEFKSFFSEEIDKFDYSKLDMPEWGSVSESKVFLERSLVEGNQVLEARFVWGNPCVDATMNQIKFKNNSPERAIKNFVFNRLYLDEYFTKKIRNGSLNIKYCPGGSRDLLFLSWYKDVVTLLDGGKKDSSCQPRCFVGAKTAVDRGVISSDEYSLLTTAVDYLTILRTDILTVNKTTRDRGLSFLDTQTLNRLFNYGYPEKHIILSEFAKTRKIVRNIVDKVSKDVINLGSTFKGAYWRDSMNHLLENTHSESDLVVSAGEDPMLIMSKLWRANNNGLDVCFSRLAQKYSDSRDWAIVGTIVNSRFCPPEILARYGQGLCKEEGFGYLLRVIARNPNTPRETLISIANDPNLEKRYTSIAKIALEHGIEGTKNQL